MPNYELEYKQPYENDVDSGSGIGDHRIEYSSQKFSFTAKTDLRAEATARQLLSQGSIFFGHHIDGDNKTHYRRLVRLVREIEFR